MLVSSLLVWWRSWIVVTRWYLSRPWWYCSTSSVPKLVNGSQPLRRIHHLSIVSTLMPGKGGLTRIALWNWWSRLVTQIASYRWNSHHHYWPYQADNDRIEVRGPLASGPAHVPKWRGPEEGLRHVDGWRGMTELQIVSELPAHNRPRNLLSMWAPIGG